MPRKATVNSAVETDVVDDSMKSVEDNMNENMKEQIKVEAKTNAEPLQDSDEIEVVSLLPNVSYKDIRTNDFYRWEKVGDKEIMTFDALKNLWRNHKSYFRNLWLKPLDERVIKKFGLEKNYTQYEFLMDSKNYKRENIEELCNAISNTPIGLKLAVCNKVQNFVAVGKINDVAVIRALEKKLGLDLISYFN